jgi:hypothetical protein
LMWSVCLFARLEKIVEKPVHFTPHAHLFTLTFRLWER